MFKLYTIEDNVSNALFFFLLVGWMFAAPRWISDGATISVPGMAHVQGYSSVQTLFLKTYPSGGEMAGRIQWRGGTYSRTLFVSS